MSRRLIFPGYYSGFSNNRMSLDIAVGLAHLTGRTLVPYSFRIPRRVRSLRDPRRPLSIVPELFDIPVSNTDEYWEERRNPFAQALECSWAGICESMFYTSEALREDQDRFQQFRNGRQFVYSFGPREDEAPDLHIKSQTLGFYSYFFHLPEPEHRGLLKVMKSLRPKAAFLQLTKRIVRSIGPFNAIHLRRGDFVSAPFTPRARSVSGREIATNLSTRMGPELPLVVCTDGSPNDEIFGSIRKHFRQVLFLDQALQSEWRRELSELPQSDELVIALLSQLVAARAEVFAGTIFSTFSALIHRERGFLGKPAEFLYCYNEFSPADVRYQRCEYLADEDGAFSWNRTRIPVNPHAYGWVREWNEAFETPSAHAAEELGTRLKAGEATLHGETIRFMPDEPHPLVGYWTNREDWLSWSVDADGEFLVEIRYACPDSSQGSRFRFGSESGDYVEGQARDSGGWYTLTPWRALGTITTRPGDDLSLKVLAKPGHAVMNFSEIRLIPVAGRA
ncbi:MAG: hypothetical protein HY791_23160 [Deltaproteobacteria bacterium]|nr:hypothetical protein [Deltaproteobacteria bacterium]